MTQDTAQRGRSKRIEHYALIGDCETAALVGIDGSIDWLCCPRFDSAACFAALLGTPDNGRWTIAPEGPVQRVTRRYLPGTLVLETRFETKAGIAVVTDFMPPRGECSDVVRIVSAEAGEVAMRMSLAIRFGYGRDIPWVTSLPDGTLRAIAGPDMTVLRTPIPLRGENKHTVATFSVRPGDAIPFVFTYRPSHEAMPDAVDPQAALADTVGFWREWSGRDRNGTPGYTAGMPAHWREAVERSLIVLKALTYAPTGGIVAAATTSLPEWIGGTRNWDYRYCWLRDGAVTLLALINSGYLDEARAWRDWLVRAMAGSVEQMQIMYGLGGERRLEEWEVPWLDGFEGSRPVRIGNAASGQVQLDVYGEVMSVLHVARVGGIPDANDAWSMQKAMLEQLETLWQQPDSGLWEGRGPPRHFTFSKIMAWVAFDRCIKSAEMFDVDQAPIERWRAIRDDIHDDICRKGFDPELGSFVQSYGSRSLDASLLLLPAFGFLPPDDPRVRGTIEAIERGLMVGGLVQRYDTQDGSDGLPPGEGTFLACSFWLANALAAIGRVDDACALFERLLTLRNDVGLLAEEYDPVAGRQLGNVPQAFSHVAVISVALTLSTLMASRPDPNGTALESSPTGTPVRST